MTTTTSSLDRRYDLDWIRVGAFSLLILYHVGMFYVPWDWHVKTPHPVEAIGPLMQLTNPWRLTLLFLVSGAATRFMADKVTVGKLTGARIARLRDRLRLFASWDVFALEAELKAFAEEEAVGFGKIGPAVRAALTGDGVSPDIAKTLAALGREESLGRLDDALQQTR